MEYLNQKVIRADKKQGKVLGYNLNPVDPNLNGLDLKNVIEKASKGVIVNVDSEPTKVDYQFYADEFSKFLNFKENKSHIVIDNYIMVKLFYTSKIIEKSTSLILTEDYKRDISNYKVFPIAVVINKGSSDKFNIGDLVTIPLNMTKTILSKEYIDYRSKLASQPSLAHEFPAPPMYIGRLNEWVSYMYQEDPFIETTIEDQHTFCLPDRFIQTKIGKDEVLEMLYKHIENNKKESNEDIKLED